MKLLLVIVCVAATCVGYHYDGAEFYSRSIAPRSPMLKKIFGDKRSRQAPWAESRTLSKIDVTAPGFDYNRDPGYLKGSMGSQPPTKIHISQEERRGVLVYDRRKAKTGAQLNGKGNVKFLAQGTKVKVKIDPRSGSAKLKRKSADGSWDQAHAGRFIEQPYQRTFENEDGSPIAIQGQLQGGTDGGKISIGAKNYDKRRIWKPSTWSAYVPFQK